MIRFMTDQTTHLRKLREAAGISLRELARQIGEHPSNVSFWERTGKLPKAEALTPIAEALGVSVDDILGKRIPRKTTVAAGRARSTFETVARLPRSQQKRILDVVDALVTQAIH
jgi:transcriptional regulator with XRE-family HTH domain